MPNLFRELIYESVTIKYLNIQIAVDDDSVIYLIQLYYKEMSGKMREKVKLVIRKLRETKAFTLLEMAIVLFIISALLLIIIPNIGSHRSTASETGNEALQTVVDTQADLFEIETGSRPGSVDALVSADYLTEAQGQQATEANITISR